MRIFVVFFLLLPAFAQTKAQSTSEQKKTIYYVQSVYSQLHQNPSKFSRVLSTFECGQPFYVLSSPISEFYQVEYSNYKGFMSTNVLAQTKPSSCWQDMYRRFFDQIDIGVTEIHYWGRLQDLLIKGESK
ncbi:SH3 domain-containing protein [Halobacteriovorax sp. XZX-3]|uniref:SH3 domain-containing protein n=1 Tax=unclassified Halobacteriovorax TaxID=2639665 RepID=UPI000CD1F825|nr:SH3 domain-containing protein [Halobacteriovorax sp. DA5]POB14880.1 hypothetical protein C0Z22_00470 [Halobacteriovorax sp. DA5]